MTLIAHRSATARLFRRLLGDERGLALLEMAFVTPVLMTIGLGGVEVANYTITHMRVSQLAVSLADNASRVKQDVVSGVPRMREVDVNEVFTAATLQSGNLDIVGKGRLILSSLEVNASGGQWIHWQRCLGKAKYASSYGVEGAGVTGTSLPGMGPAGRQVQAASGYAIMFVEVVYDYKPLVFGQVVKAGPIRKMAAMYVRDNRDLTQIYNPSPAAVANKCV